MTTIFKMPNRKFTDVHKQMNLNPFTLFFKGEIEKKFRKDYFHSSLALLRASFILGIVYYAAFAFLDIAVYPEMKSQLFIIRFLFVCPVILFVFLLSYLKNFRKIWQLAASIAIFAAGMGIIIMPNLSVYYTGLILVLIYCYLLIKLRFIWATITGWTLVIFYGVAVYLFSDVPKDIFLTNSFFLISANILGMFGSYYLEYYTRRVFYLRNLLNEEQQKVVSINQELELRVKERTKEIEDINTVLQKEIAGHKHAEQELIKHRENLEELVKERTKELEGKNKKLEEFNDLFVNREFRIKELKDKVKELEEKNGAME